MDSVKSEMFQANDDVRHLRKRLRAIDYAEYSWQSKLIAKYPHHVQNRIRNEIKAIQAEYVKPVCR